MHIYFSFARVGFSHIQHLVLSVLGQFASTCLAYSSALCVAFHIGEWLSVARYQVHIQEREFDSWDGPCILKFWMEIRSESKELSEYTRSISPVKLLFLDMYLIPRDDRIATSIYYKETDSHSYLNFKSSHPSQCKSAILYSQFLRLRKICSEDDDFEVQATTMETFFVARGYPATLVRRGREKAISISRPTLLAATNENKTATNRVPMVTTYHPKNMAVCGILSRNFQHFEKWRFNESHFPSTAFESLPTCQKSVGPVGPQQFTAKSSASTRYFSLRANHLSYLSFHQYVHLNNNTRRSD